jgi:hypothetical protein
MPGQYDTGSKRRVEARKIMPNELKEFKMQFGGTYRISKLSAEALRAVEARLGFGCSLDLDFFRDFRRNPLDLSGYYEMVSTRRDPRQAEKQEERSADLLGSFCFYD